MTPEIIITQHAYERAKERLSLSPASLDRMAERAFTHGIKHADTKGRLHKYITHLWFDYRKADNIRLYGEFVYLFADVTLVTLFQLPRGLRKHAKLIRDAS